MMRIVPRRRVQFSFAELKGIFRWLLTKDKASMIGTFERAFAAYVGVDLACVVPSGRMGLSLLLDCLDFKDGDEVILAGFNYHVVSFLLKSKGLNLVFVDIKPGTFNIHVDLIEAKITANTKCLLATHLFGQACDIERIQRLCKKHNLILIEDVAHSLGARVHGRKVGSYGDFAFYSFGTGKAMMTFSGGMVTSNDPAVMEQLRAKVAQQKSSCRLGKTFKHFIMAFLQIILTNRIIFSVFVYPLLSVLEGLRFDIMKGMTGESYTVRDLKLKGRLSLFTSFQAAVGLVQLSRLDPLNRQRVHNARLLTSLLTGLKDAPMCSGLDDGSNVVLYYPFLTEQVDEFRKYLLFRGIDTKLCGMRHCAFLTGSEGVYPQADKVDCKVIELPCCPGVTDKDISYQAGLIRSFFADKKESEQKEIKDE